MIDHKHKLLHIDICRTASTSVHNAFVECYGFPPRIRHTSITNVWKHRDTPIITRDEVRDYFTFTFVRNPYDRMVSAWCSAPSRYGSRFTYRSKYLEFVDFAEVVAKEMTTPYNQHNVRAMAWWMPQCCWLGADYWDPQLDFIGRFENLHEDYDKLRDMLEERGLKRPPDLDHYNKSEHMHYSKYYDDRALELVTRYCARDLELFNYEFEDLRRRQS